MSFQKVEPMTLLNVPQVHLLPTYQCYQLHDEKDRFKKCEINTQGSLNRIWCNVHHGPQYSCIYHDDNSTHNAPCNKCCSEKSYPMTKQEYDSVMLKLKPKKEQ